LNRADKSSDLQQVVNQLKKDWKEKYGQELQFANQQSAFSDQFARIIESNPAENAAANGARAAAERIPPGDRNTSAAPHAEIDRSKDVEHSGDKNIDKNGAVRSDQSPDRSAHGVSSSSTDFNKANTSSAKSGTVEMRGTDRPMNQPADVKVATVTVPASHGAPEVTLHLTSDSSGQWSVDLPNTLDRQKLQANLAKHIRQFDEQKGVWPKDVAEASRMAVHHVFLALADKDVAASHQAEHGNADLSRQQGQDVKPTNTVVPPGTSGTIDSSQRNPR
jgi:hypothetical protein